MATRLNTQALSSADYREGLVARQRPLSLNPLVGAEDPAVRDVGHLLYRGLMRLDDRAAPVPDLATQMTTSADGLTYRAALRSGLTWSDGKPITAADVVTTVAFMQSPQFTDASRQAGWQGVHAKAGGGGVDFTLTSPRAGFLAVVADLPILPIGDDTDFAALINRATTPMPTSGAYRVAAAQTDGIRLEPNPHAASTPHLNSVVLHLYADFSAAARALAAGDIDGLIAATSAERALVSGTAHVTRHDITTFRFVDLIFNERIPGLSDAAVRNAIAGIVDRAALVDKAVDGAGVAQKGPIPAGITWATGPSTSLAPNPGAARASLDAAGWLLGPDGVRKKGTTRLSFTLSVPDIAPLPAVANEVVRQVAGIGIDAHVTTVPDAEFVVGTLRPHLFQLAVADWDNGPDPDVSAYWRSSAVPPQGFNVSGGPVDAFLDQDLDSLATLSDSAARLQAAGRVSTQLAEDLPAVFLYAPTVTVLVSDSIHDVTVPPTGGSAARFDLMPAWRRG